MVPRILFAVLLLAPAFSFGAEEEPKPASAVTYYNFSELLNKAERVLLGEIGESKDGAVTIKALETLKSPAHDTKKITPDMVKRAEELLASDKAPAAPVVQAHGEVENVNVTLITGKGIKLPPAGVQAVFFLWDPEKFEEGKPPTYRVNHPQSIYDSAALPQVRAALFKPRSISDGRFLRDWDRRAAQRAAQRKADDELKQIPGGEPVLGLKIEALRPKLLLRGDNSFQVATHLVNTFDKETMVYDGPAGAYGVILRAKGAAPETSIVLRLSGFEGVDPAAMEITNQSDFATVAGNQIFTREQLVDVKNFPVLKTLSGAYVLKAFYTNRKDGTKIGLDSPAWTGLIVSKEIPIDFKDLKTSAATR
jgi:hypothetical protein